VSGTRVEKFVHSPSSFVYDGIPIGGLRTFGPYKARLFSVFSVVILLSGSVSSLQNRGYIRFVLPNLVVQAG
jgi:hypothetical protein